MSKHINKVFSMIQTELKSEKVQLEKVELALDLGGLKSYARNLKSKFSNYQKKFSVLDDMVREVRSEAQELDKLSDKFNQEMDEQLKEGRRLAKELGVKFQDTAVGKEWEKIAGDMLSGKYDAIKKGLAIDIS